VGPEGAWRTGADDPLMALHSSYPTAVFTSLFNVTGQPAITVPVHHDEAAGLPVGVQIVAAPWREDLLLQVARRLDVVHGWTDRHPPIGGWPAVS
jgi:amidase